MDETLPPGPTCLHCGERTRFQPGPVTPYIGPHHVCTHCGALWRLVNDDGALGPYDPSVHGDVLQPGSPGTLQR